MGRHRGPGSIDAGIEKQTTTRIDAKGNAGIPALEREPERGEQRSRWGLGRLAAANYNVTGQRFNTAIHIICRLVETAPTASISAISATPITVNDALSSCNNVVSYALRCPYSTSWESTCSFQAPGAVNPVAEQPLISPASPNSFVSQDDWPFCRVFAPSQSNGRQVRYISSKSPSSLTECQELRIIITAKPQQSTSNCPPRSFTIRRNDDSSKTVPSFAERFEFHITTTNSKATTIYIGSST
ncbi:hypothetical protein TRIATDRAFT_272848 [Trichoderma atroviride IMI 206040]|uniref:Uncharacterized protein n=1 Tax=Hypocrea atroviridis (strain ATCC 20476 / IMI 206040) TaxID=452589 RepID=G9NR85_HYPAI|nr:uncharacterized protein TRIATDRAFT_272848 [Trichoderma atroviride IMI 206040]EHK47053.1 hypothetical protein TRIATDRAFT_272848 [Trichoderma atroviride IMI 206040]